MSSSKGLHPEITNILNKRDLIFNAIYLEKNPLKSIQLMIGLHKGLDPDDKDPTLEMELEAEETALTQLQPVRMKVRFKQNRIRYRKWLETLDIILWDKGYKENKKYAPERRKSRISFNNE